MSTAEDPGHRASPVARAIRWLLIFQICIGALLLGGDLGGAWTGLPFGAPDAPRLDQPVRPGDQRRLYDPAMPSPGQREGMPVTDMPDRLTFRTDGGTGIVTGAISPGDAERFADWLDGLPTLPETVRLASPGGSVDDALSIGRSLRRAGLATEVQTVCLSACPYVFAAGTARIAGDAAQIGVHQHYFGESTILPAFMAVEDVQRGQGEVMQYLDDMGVDVRVMSLALTTPPDEIYILLPEELERYNVVTE